MIEEPKIKALQPWFGGKRTMAPLVAEELGFHSQYFEPFCGSMAVLFAKDPSQKETVNDMHGDLINLAFVIQDPNKAVDLYDRLQRVLFCDEILDRARDVLEQPRPETPCVDRAYWYFIAGWMGRNGTAGTARLDYQIAVRWTKGGGSPTVRFQNALESLPAWHNRLRNVVILQRNAFDIIDRFEDVAGTVTLEWSSAITTVSGSGNCTTVGRSSSTLARSICTLRTDGALVRKRLQKSW